MERPPKQEQVPAIVKRFTKESPEWRERRKQIADLINEMHRLEESGEAETASNYTPPKELLENFYREAREEFARIPLTKEQIETSLTSEHLSKLSLEDYKELLKRLPPRYMSHVTRQGIRDHVSHHDDRLDEFHHGLEAILETGALRSILEQKLLDGITRASVEQVLRESLGIPGEEYLTRASATDRVYHFLTSGKYSPSDLVKSEVADARSLHLAMDMVADTFYGGEEGNEVFFVYPSAYIASQCVMGSQIRVPPKKLDATKEGDTSKNDFWIQLKTSGAGALPLDAGLVFLPKDAKVDPKTGSLYETEQGRPLQNTDQLKALEDFARTNNWRAVFDRLEGINSERGSLEGDLRRNEKDYRIFSDERETKRQAIELAMAGKREELEKLLAQLRGAGVTDPRIETWVNEDSFFAFERLRSISRWLNEVTRPHVTEADRKNSLAYNALRHKLAEHPVSAQTYWERFFEKRGGRPSKIIWYGSEIRPSEAVQEFFTAVHGGTGAHPDVDLKEMFQENMVNQATLQERMKPERELMWKYAQELLDEWYPAAEEEEHARLAVKRKLQERREWDEARPKPSTDRKPWSI